MARKDQEQVIRERIAVHLEPGEQIYHVAYGVKQPNIFLIILLFLIGILVGLIAVFMITKHYYVALTDRRLIVLQFSGKKDKKVMSFTPGNLGGELKTKFGAIFTHLRIDNPQQKVVMKFNRAGFANNRPAAEAICNALHAAESGQPMQNPAPMPPNPAAMPPELPGVPATADGTPPPPPPATSNDDEPKAPDTTA